MKAQTAEDWAKRLYSLAEQGRSDLALKVAESAVQRHPEDGELWYLLGCARESSGNPAGAAVAFQKSYTVQPSPVTAQRLAYLYVSSNRSQDAIALLEHELSREPRNPQLQADLGRLYRIRFSYADAIERFRAALNLDPANLSNWSDLFGSLLEVGKVSDATTELGRCENILATNSIIAYWRGRVALVEGDAESAAKQIGEAIEQIPDVSAIWIMYHGQALSAAGRLEEAKEALERAVSVKPDLEAAYYQLGMVYRRLGDAPAARQNLSIHQLLRGDRRKGWESLPEDHGAYLFIRERLAVEALEDDDLAGAIEHASAVVATKPNRMQAVMTLAKAYREIGDATNALETCRIAEPRLGADPEFQIFVADLLEALGQSEKGREHRDLAEVLRCPFSSPKAGFEHTPAADSR